MSEPKDMPRIWWDEGAIAFEAPERASASYRAVCPTETIPAVLPIGRLGDHAVRLMPVPYDMTDAEMQTLWEMLHEHRRAMLPPMTGEQAAAIRRHFREGAIENPEPISDVEFEETVRRFSELGPHDQAKVLSIEAVHPGQVFVLRTTDDLSADDMVTMTIAWRRLLPHSSLVIIPAGSELAAVELDAAAERARAHFIRTVYGVTASPWADLIEVERERWRGVARAAFDVR